MHSACVYVYVCVVRQLVLIEKKKNTQTHTTTHEKMNDEMNEMLVPVRRSTYTMIRIRIHVCVMFNRIGFMWIYSL